MGTSIYDQYLKEKSNPSVYDQYLAEKSAAKKVPSVASDASGVDKNAAANRQAQALAPRDEPYVYEGPSFRDDPLGATKEMGKDVLAAAAAMSRPLEGVQAHIRAPLRGQTYDEALSDIRESYRRLPSGAALGAQLLPAIASMGATAAPTALGGAAANLLKPVTSAIGRVAAPVTDALSPATNLLTKVANKAIPSPVGRTVGGTAATIRALRADDEPISSRIGGTLAHGAFGYLGGLGAEYGAAALKGSSALTPGANIKGNPKIGVVGREATRDAEAGPAYEAFRNLGDLGSSPELDKILNLRAVRIAERAIRGENTAFTDMPTTDSRFLDELYKRVGNKAFRAQHGFQLEGTTSELGNAIEALAQKRGVSFRGAVDPFAEASAGINAVERGRDAVHTGAASRQTTEGSPEAYGKWFREATPSEQQAAIEGIKGEIGSQPLTRRVIMPSRELQSGVRLLRESGEPLIPKGVSDFFSRNRRFGGDNGIAPAGPSAPPPQLGSGQYEMGSDIRPRIGGSPAPRGLLKAGPSAPPPQQGPAIPMRGRGGVDEGLRRLPSRAGVPSPIGSPGLSDIYRWENPPIKGLLSAGPAEGSGTMRAQMPGQSALGPEVQAGVVPDQQRRAAMEAARNMQLEYIRKLFGLDRLAPHTDTPLP